MRAVDPAADERSPVLLYDTAVDRRSRVGFPPDEGDSFDIRFLLFATLRGMWLIAIFGVIGVALGVRSLMNFGPTYEAAMVVSSGEQGGGNSLSSALTSAGARLGIDLSTDSASATTFDRLRITLGSISLARLLDEKYGMVRRLWGGSWDEAKQEWIKPVPGRFEMSQELRARLHLPTWSAPTVESLASHLQGAVRVSKMTDPPFYKITYRSNDPAMALWLLQTVYREADDLLRAQDRAQAIERKAYVEDRLRTTVNLEGRSMFTNMLANEERRLMLLDTDTPYAAQIIDPAFVSSQPSTPDPVRDFGIVVVGWILAGVFVVVLIALLRSPRRT
jgi:hypothetical protein